LLLLVLLLLLLLLHQLNSLLLLYCYLPHRRRLCAIFKAFMCLNEAGLLEALLSDKFFVRVAGVFEYDPELRGRARHREFLTNVAQFKQILPIEVCAISSLLCLQVSICTDTES
jgi:Component of IIS longevity pathway SMK-1